MRRFLRNLLIFASAAVCLAEHDPGHEEGAEWTGKPWLGKWVSVPEKDVNVLNFITEIGVAASHPELPPIVTVLVNHYKKGDEYHQRLRVKEVADLDDHDIVYKLGQETKNVFNGTTFSVKYDEKDDALVGQVMLPSNNATYKNEFKVEGDFLVKTSDAHGIVHKRYYKRRN
ncbi:SAHS11 [Ramazzottius varieornatus]|uniref:SAHS11 n=1 Tax=Ramazzottius varieornatus TaxID=947166 RepID=A0A1D1URS8_RAMVA|nr:SAHS11 [Ramazzottius varieornatus]